MDSNNFKSKDFASTLIQFCFNLKDFKDLLYTRGSSSASHIFNCHADLLEKAEALISSPSEGIFLANMESAAISVQHTLRVYESITISFDNKEQLTVLLKLLEQNLTTVNETIKQ